MDSDEIRSPLQIDKGVPMPNVDNRRNKYPWRQMEVGDSFFAPGKNVSIVTSARTTEGKAFRGRACVEGGIKGCRVWRVK